ncbi:MAG: TetR/AcrR family transcriptional regulator [Clostridia bacterium]|nr:TetR/AcrR family transcriptional regulator [Clostridia bacterium]
MDSTKVKIMEAAKELFAEKGYTSVRTKEIADCAGVNETTLFRNFKSKKHLYDEILVSNISSIDSQNLFHSEMSGDVQQDLINVSSQMFMLYKSSRQIIKMVMKGMIQEENPAEKFADEFRGSHIRKHMKDYFSGLNKSGRIKDDPELITELYMNCVNGYLMSTFVLDEKEADLKTLMKMTEKIASCIAYSK